MTVKGVRMVLPSPVSRSQKNAPMSTFDPLDMNNYKVEKLPKMQKSNFEKWMARLGGPLAIIAFVLIYWCCHIGFIRAFSVERIAEPSYGFDQLVPPWPVYLLAQPRYAGLHDVRARIEAVSPYPFEDHVP